MVPLWDGASDEQLLRSASWRKQTLRLRETVGAAAVAEACAAALGEPPCGGKGRGHSCGGGGPGRRRGPRQAAIVPSLADADLPALRRKAQRGV